MCVDKEWRFHSDRSLRLRLDELRRETSPDIRLDVASELPRNHPPARRCANVAELRRALDEEGSCKLVANYLARIWRRACRLAAAVHGVVLGPAYVSHPPRPRGPRLHPFFFVERAQLYVELYEDEAGAAMSAYLRGGNRTIREFETDLDRATRALMRKFAADGPPWE